MMGEKGWWGEEASDELMLLAGQWRRQGYGTQGSTRKVEDTEQLSGLPCELPGSLPCLHALP